jgi:hypothetical protein
VQELNPCRLFLETSAPLTELDDHHQQGTTHSALAGSAEQLLYSMQGGPHGTYEHLHLLHNQLG